MASIPETASLLLMRLSIMFECPWCIDDRLVHVLGEDYLEFQLQGGSQKAAQLLSNVRTALEHVASQARFESIKDEVPTTPPANSGHRVDRKSRSQPEGWRGVAGKRCIHRRSASSA